MWQIHMLAPPERSTSPPIGNPRSTLNNKDPTVYFEINMSTSAPITRIEKDTWFYGDLGDCCTQILSWLYRQEYICKFLKVFFRIFLLIVDTSISDY